jgi:mono/diheme cytochrome c family protein
MIVKRIQVALLVSCLAVLPFAALLAAGLAQDTLSKQAPKNSSQPGEGQAFFDSEVQPILKANCYKCHADGKARGGFSLADRVGLLKGGDLGPAVVLDRPDDSLLLKAINHREDLAMPPSPAAKLSPKEIDILTRWVKAGAPGLPEKVAASAANVGRHITDEDRSYWAYQAPKRPQVPTVKHNDVVRNPVDAFILAGLEAKGLNPAPPADRLTLCRRVYFDLIGLPPTPAEVDEFVNDQAPDAYERLVDRLLESPHYGEKWARHWLDLMRYGETNGFEFDQPKPFIWRYRDYVIEAFNKDKPYDQFVREQIAGDLLDPLTRDSLIATGYFRVGQWDSGAADRTLQKYEVLDSILSTTAQVFLGMSIGCARCHNHKADPILQSDYYRLLAFFHNISDYGARNTRKIAAAIEEENAEKFMREKQDRELELAREIHQMEQRFAATLAKKKGLKLSDIRQSDLVDVTYRFYRDTWEKLPDFDTLLHETEGPIASSYFTLAPASRQEAIGFVFEGKLKVLQAGTFTFDVESTDGVRLIVDGKTVINLPDLGKHSASNKTELRAGFLPIRLEYFNGNGQPQLKIEWSGPGIERHSLTETAGQEKVDLASLIRSNGPGALTEKERQPFIKLVDELRQSLQTTADKFGIQVSAVVETGSAPTYLLIRGNPQAKGDRVEPGYPEVLIPEKTAAVKGGRLALANWIADSQNPLTARVMVNRLWQHHFGRGIVPTPNDFGKQGENSTHTELLDWLANEFVAGGWKIKRMHKLLMTSNTYRMTSKANEQGLKTDPSNMLFWRFNMRRLAAEEVRDSMLAISGRLNLQMAGPSVFPPIPRAVLAGQARPGTGWKPSPPEEAARRSIYVHTKRSLLVPILAQFDQADTDASCPVRFTTTVPTQALGLLNDDFGNEQAKLFAERLKRDMPESLDAQVKRAIRLTTGRIPSNAEVAKDVAFISSLRRENNLTEMDALRIYCLMALNTNEFIYLD